MQLNPVLFITYSYPPDSAVGGRRVARFCRYLPSFGFRPIVLTVEPRHVETIDDSFAARLDVRVERTEIWPTPLELYARWRSRGRAQSPDSRPNPAKPVVRDTALMRNFKRHLFGLLRMPDAHWGWYGPALRAAEKLIREESIQAIFSTAPPWTVQLIARRLKEKFGLPWIADFRDAWTLDSWRAEWHEIPAWRDRIDRRWEASCVQLADLVTTVSPETTEKFRRHYSSLPAEKFVTITNGYDDVEEDLGQEDIAEDTSETRLMVYLGELYGDRRIDNFCRAVADLVRAGKLSGDSFKLLIVGNASPHIVGDARRAAPELFEDGQVELRSQVSWQEARKIMHRARLLLIFQGSHRLAIPAKFYDYLQTGKPIFALVEQGALSKFIEDTKSGVWADPSDPDFIAQKLLQALSLPQRSSAEVERTAGQFHARNLTASLAASFNRLIEPAIPARCAAAEQFQGTST